MKTICCLATILFLLLASMMLWMGELVSRAIVISPVSPTRYFVAALLFGMLATGFLRAVVENQNGLPK